MKMNDYLFIYERIDGSRFEVINKFASADVAEESAKLALSKHHDLKSCAVYELEIKFNLDRSKV